MEFTVEEALQYAKDNRIKEWIYTFLTTDGDNKILGEQLYFVKRFFTGPIKIPIKYLERCMGPEPHMEYVDQTEGWDKHLTWFQQLISEGWDMPPLIAQHIDGRLSVRDGNHRLGAMERDQFEDCWVIVWDDHETFDLNTFLDKQKVV